MQLEAWCSCCKARGKHVQLSCHHLDQRNLPSAVGGITFVYDLVLASYSADPLLLSRRLLRG